MGPVRTRSCDELNVLDGTVLGRNMQRHRHQEFIRFLNAIEKRAPAGKTIQAIVDNYATHKHPKVRQWLARHPRWTFHFTPTSVAQRRRGFFRDPDKAAIETRRVPIGRRSLKPRSTASSKSTINSPSPTLGPPIQTKSSPLSNEGTKC
jgi:hypothetical protein